MSGLISADLCLWRCVGRYFQMRGFGGRLADDFIQTQADFNVRFDTCFDARIVQRLQVALRVLIRNPALEGNGLTTEQLLHCRRFAFEQPRQIGLCGVELDAFTHLPFKYDLEV